MAKLSQIVGYFLDLENYGDAEYARAYRFAVRGLQTELELDVIGKICTHKICIKKDRTATLPENTIRVNNVGYDYSADLDESCSKMTDVQFEKHIANFKPPYKIDYNTRTITFDASYNYDEIELETLDRAELCGDTDIDERLTNTLVAYIKWQWEIGKKGNSAGVIDYYMRDFHRQKTNAKFWVGKPTNRELWKEAREHTFYGIKS